jgi:phosphoribosylformylglycinamidine synthase
MIYRVEVFARPAASGDPKYQPCRANQELIARIKTLLGVAPESIERSAVYLIDALDPLDKITTAARELLADPISEQFRVFCSVNAAPPPPERGESRIEVHLKPGVMDPVAASTQEALRDLGLTINQVRTGRAYLIKPHLPADQLQKIGSALLANVVIDEIRLDRFLPANFPQPPNQPQTLRYVTIRQAEQADLDRISRRGHLFLSPVEMRAVQAYYREQQREPTDVELETIAQTWSEHCVHKTLKSPVDVIELDSVGREISRRHYDNLIRDTIFSATRKLMQGPAGQWCLSVFKDNAGIIAFDDADAVCMKVETHNHPSAIDPYGGSATGIGGCIRDILGTGLGARPIASTDVFCVAHPDETGNAGPLPGGIIPPRRVLEQVVAGVRDYGNRMGIPTVNGAVYFDQNYLGNPLVFCGCVGLIPRNAITKAAAPGDAIVLVGGRTGRDGIHGATFSSAELSDTHAQEFGHAVQIGNAITQKKMADVLLAARDRKLFSAITDCGAGGLSSAVGEMAADIGAIVDLEKVPLKYAGLRYDEIWISEAQERMVVAVPVRHVDELLRLAKSEDVEASVIGTFGNRQSDSSGGGAAELLLRHNGSEVGRLWMQFLHHGLPMPTRTAKTAVPAPKPSAKAAVARKLAPADLRDHLLKTLADPNIASKHWIIRQYDHEVQAGTLVKPLTGPMQLGPSDAAVIRPKPHSLRGIAIGCGLAPWIADPYEMAVASIDEAVRNIVCVGADPARIALLDNFCWPSVDDERTMGQLVRACEACRDVSLAYGMPFISGKDSLHNQFVDRETGRIIRIPPTLLISAIGLVGDVRNCVTMDLKGSDSRVFLVRPRESGRGDLLDNLAVHSALARQIAAGNVLAVHDVSEGGWLVALAEMCIADGKGAAVNQELLEGLDAAAIPLASYLVELKLPPAEAADLFGNDAAVAQAAQSCQRQQFVIPHSSASIEIPIADLTLAWRGTLDW